jgi:hypothetical protein
MDPPPRRKLWVRPVLAWAGMAVCVASAGALNDSGATPYAAALAVCLIVLAGF